MGPQPRERETRQLEGLDLASVIERAQSHDAEALGEIHHRYVRRVLGLCRYMLDSRESAEDATSEVFLKLQRSIASYDGSTPFPRWLLRVAGNQCIDVLRRSGRAQKVLCYVPIRSIKWRMPLSHVRSEEHTSELQSPHDIAYAVFCL